MAFIWMEEDALAEDFEELPMPESETRNASTSKGPATAACGSEFGDRICLGIRPSNFGYDHRPIWPRVTPSWLCNLSSRHNAAPVSSPRNSAW